MAGFIPAATRCNRSSRASGRPSARPCLRRLASPPAARRGTPRPPVLKPADPCTPPERRRAWRTLARASREQTPHAPTAGSAVSAARARRRRRRRRRRRAGRRSARRWRTAHPRQAQIGQRRPRDSCRIRRHQAEPVTCQSRSRLRRAAKLRSARREGHVRAVARLGVGVLLCRGGGGAAGGRRGEGGARRGYDQAGIVREGERDKARARRAGLGLDSGLQRGKWCRGQKAAT
mgnify:CR=1 FL=1